MSWTETFKRAGAGGWEAFKKNKKNTKSNFASFYPILEWSSALESYGRKTIWLSLSFSNHVAEF